MTEDKQVQTEDKCASTDFESTYIEADDIVIIDDCKEEMPCNMYNSVVSELKNRFSSSSDNQTEVKMPFDD